MKIEAPRLTFARIRQIADEVRAGFKNQSLPIEILDAIEFDLGYEIRPVKGLRDDGNTDALLLRNEKAILIDQEYYLDDRQQNRVRFSVAHELGHAFLHPDFALEFNSIDEWVLFQESISPDSFEWFESQADEFAGRLLVPVEALKKAISAEVAPLLKTASRNELESDEVIDVIATFINQRFGVSSNVLAIRIQREKLWPPNNAL